MQSDSVTIVFKIKDHEKFKPEWEHIQDRMFKNLDGYRITTVSMIDLSDEVERLQKLLDENGVKYDESE